jgi:hypothetical protein
MKFDRVLKSDLELSRFKLEEESSEFASVYYYWSEKAVEAKADRDRAKGQLDLTSATRELDIRNNPPEGTKLTESSVKALLEMDPTVLSFKKIYADSVECVNLLEASVRGLEAKKSQIDNLTRLWIAGYYSSDGKVGNTEEPIKEQRQLLKRATQPKRRKE